MANRIVLNETSYHGAGAINEIPGEVTKRGFHKAFIASDPDLVKFGVTAKVTKILEENGYLFIDCQFHTEHLESMGGRYVPWEEYNQMLEEGTNRSEW